MAFLLAFYLIIMEIKDNLRKKDVINLSKNMIMLNLKDTRLFIDIL